MNAILAQALLRDKQYYRQHPGRVTLSPLTQTTSASLSPLSPLLLPHEAGTVMPNNSTANDDPNNRTVKLRPFMRPGDSRTDREEGIQMAPRSAWPTQEAYERALVAYDRAQAFIATKGGVDPAIAAAQEHQFHAGLVSGTLSEYKAGKVAELAEQSRMRPSDTPQLRKQASLLIHGGQTPQTWNAIPNLSTTPQEKMETRVQRHAAEEVARPEVEAFYEKMAQAASKHAGRAVNGEEIRTFIPSLSGQQLEYVTSDAPVNVALAGPGSGKSTATRAKVLYDILVNGADPRSYTFTSKTHSANRTFIDAFNADAGSGRRDISELIPGWTRDVREQQTKTLDYVVRRQLHSKIVQTEKYGDLTPLQVLERSAGTPAGRALLAQEGLADFQAGAKPFYQTPQGRSETFIDDDVEKARNTLSTFIGSALKNQGVTEGSYDLKELTHYVIDSKQKRMTGGGFQDRITRGKALFDQFEQSGRKGPPMMGQLHPDLALYISEQAMNARPGFTVPGQQSAHYDLSDEGHLLAAALRIARKIPTASVRSPITRLVSDEFQDADPNHVSALKELTHGRSDMRMAFSGDMGQMAVRRSYPIDQQVMEAFSDLGVKKHDFTGNYRSGPYGVALSNSINTLSVMKDQPQSPMQVSMLPMGSSDLPPKMYLGPSYQNVHRKMVKDWLRNSGTSLGTIKYAMERGQHPFEDLTEQNAPGRNPFVFQTESVQKAFLGTLHGMLSRTMGDTLTEQFMKKYVSTSVPSPEHAMKIQALKINAIRGRDAERAYLDVGQAGMWDVAGYADNLRIMTSRARQQNRLYASMANLPGGATPHDMTPSSFQGEAVAPGFDVLLQVMSELAHHQQNVPMQQMPGWMARAAASPTPLTDAHQGGMGPIQDRALIEAYADEVFALNKHHQPPVGAVSVSGIYGIEEVGREAIYGHQDQGEDATAIDQMNVHASLNNLRGRNKNGVDRSTQLQLINSFIRQHLIGGPAGGDFGELPEETASLISFFQKQFGRADSKASPDMMELIPGANGPFPMFPLPRTEEFFGKTEGLAHGTMKVAPGELIREHDDLGQLVKAELSNTSMHAQMLDSLRASRYGEYAPLALPTDDPDRPGRAASGEDPGSFAYSDEQPARDTLTGLLKHVHRDAFVRDTMPRLLRGFLGKADFLQSGKMAEKTIDNLVAGGEVALTPDFVYTVAEAAEGRARRLSVYTDHASFLRNQTATLREQYGGHSDIFSPVSLSQENLDRIGQVDPFHAAVTRSLLQDGSLFLPIKEYQRLPKTDQTFLQGLRDRGLMAYNPKKEQIDMSAAQYASLSGSGGEGDTRKRVYQLMRSNLYPVGDTNAHGETIMHPEVRKRLNQFEYLPGTVMRTLSPQEGARMRIPLHQMRNAPALARLTSYLSLMSKGMGTNESGGIIDPQAVRARASGGSQLLGAGMALPQYEARLRDQIKRMGPSFLKTAYGAHLWDQYDQVRATRQAFSAPRNQLRYAHVARVIMRATTGEDVQGDYRDPKSIDPIKKFFAPAVGHARTVEQVMAVHQSLEGAASHLEEHGSLKRSHVDAVLQALGHDPSDKKFTALRHLERTLLFKPTKQNADPSVSLEALIESFSPEGRERNNLVAQLTRTPLVPGMQYQFMGGAEGFGGLADAQLRNPAVQSGLVGHLESFDEKTPFGLSKYLGAMFGTHMLTQDEVDYYNQFRDPKTKQNTRAQMDMQPLLQFVTQGLTGKKMRFPVRADQLRLAPIAQIAAKEAAGGASPSSPPSHGGGEAAVPPAASFAGSPPPPQQGPREASGPEATPRHATAGGPSPWRQQWEEANHHSRQWKEEAAQWRQQWEAQAASRMQQREAEASARRQQWEEKVAERRRQRAAAEEEKASADGGGDSASAPPPPSFTGSSPEQTAPLPRTLFLSGPAGRLALPPGRGFTLVPPEGILPSQINLGPTIEPMGGSSGGGGGGERPLLTQRAASLAPGGGAPMGENGVPSQADAPFPSPQDAGILQSALPSPQGRLALPPGRGFTLVPQDAAPLPDHIALGPTILPMGGGGRAGGGIPPIPPPPRTPSPPPPPPPPPPPSESGSGGTSPSPSPSPHRPSVLLPDLASLGTLLRTTGAVNVGGATVFPPTDEQRHILDTQTRHMMVEGGPGAGKTLTVGTKVADMIARGEVLPEEIAAMSATRSGASELTKHFGWIQSLLKQVPGLKRDSRYKMPHASTFHGIAYRTLFGESQPEDESAGTPAQASPLMQALGLDHFGKDILSNIPKEDISWMTPHELKMLGTLHSQSDFFKEAVLPYLHDRLGKVGGSQAKLTKSVLRGGTGIDKALESIGVIKRGTVSGYQDALALGQKHVQQGVVSKEALLHLYERHQDKKGMPDFDDIMNFAGVAIQSGVKGMVAPGSEGSISPHLLPDFLSQHRLFTVDEGQDLFHNQARLLKGMMELSQKTGGDPRLMVGFDRGQSLFPGLGGLENPVGVYSHVVGEHLSPMQLRGNMRSDRAAVAMNNAILNMPQMKDEPGKSPMQFPFSPERGSDPVFKLAGSQSELYQTAFRSMLAHAGVSFSEMKTNLATSKDGNPFEGIDWNAPGRTLLPSQIPMIFSMRRQQKAFSKQAKSVLQQELGLSGKKSWKALHHIYRQGAPGDRMSQEEVEKAEHQFWGMRVAGARSRQFAYPHVDVTRVGQWLDDDNIVSHLKSMFTGLSRVSRGGHNVIMATDRPYKEMSSAKSEKNEFEQYQGRAVPAMFGQIMQERDRQLASFGPAATAHTTAGAGAGADARRGAMPPPPADAATSTFSPSPQGAAASAGGGEEGGPLPLSGESLADVKKRAPALLMDLIGKMSDIHAAAAGLASWGSPTANKLQQAANASYKTFQQNPKGGTGAYAAVRDWTLLRDYYKQAPGGGLTPPSWPGHDLLPHLHAYRDHLPNGDANDIIGELPSLVSSGSFHGSGSAGLGARRSGTTGGGDTASGGVGISAQQVNITATGPQPTINVSAQGATTITPSPSSFSASQDTRSGGMGGGGPSPTGPSPIGPTPAHRGGISGILTQPLPVPPPPPPSMPSVSGIGVGGGGGGTAASGGGEEEGGDANASTTGASTGKAGSGKGGNTRGLMNNTISNLGHTVARIGGEMQFVGKLFDQITTQALEQGSAYRRASIPMHGSPSGTEGFYDFTNGASGISQMQQATPMYSKVQVAQYLRTLSASTGNQMVNVPQATQSLLSLAAVSGVAPEELITQNAQIAGTLGRGANMGGVSQQLTGGLTTMYGTNLTPENVLPTLSAIGQTLPTLQGLSLGQGSQLSPLMALLHAGIAGGMTPGNMGDMSEAINSLAQMGSSPDLQQQYALSQLFGHQNLTAGVSLAQYQQTQVGERQQLSELTLQQNIGNGMSLPQLQINVAQADVSMQKANLDMSALQYSHDVASFQFQQNYQTQEFGPIGADVSRNSYFDFMRNQMQAGYNPLSAETGTTFKSSPVFGLQNAQFYAGVEHQRTMLTLGRSPLLSDAAYQEQMKYLNEQEAFYHEQLKLQNEQRQFEKSWTQRLLDEQGVLLDLQKKRYALDVQMNAYQQKLLKLQEQYLPQQAAALSALMSAQGQSLRGQGPLNGQMVAPDQIITALARYTGKDLTTHIQGLGFSLKDQNTVLQMVQGVQKYGSLTSLEASQQKNDKALLSQYQQMVKGGAFADTSNTAAIADAFLNFAGKDGTWNNFVKAFQDADTTWKYIGQELSGLNATMKDISTILQVAGPLLTGVATVMNSIGFVQTLIDIFKPKGGGGWADYTDPARYAKPTPTTPAESTPTEGTGAAAGKISFFGAGMYPDAPQVNMKTRTVSGKKQYSTDGGKTWHGDNNFMDTAVGAVGNFFSSTLPSWWQEFVPQDHGSPQQHGGGGGASFSKSGPGSSNKPTMVANSFLSPSQDKAIEGAIGTFFSKTLPNWWTTHVGGPFGAWIGGLPKWFSQNIAGPFNAWIGSLPKWFSQNIATPFTGWIASLPKWFSQNIAGPFNGWIAGLPKWFSQNIAAPFTTWIGTLPKWFSTNIGDPIMKNLIQPGQVFFTKTLPDGWNTLFTKTIPDIWSKDITTPIATFFTKTMPDLFTKTITDFLKGGGSSQSGGNSSGSGNIFSSIFGLLFGNPPKGGGGPSIPGFASTSHAGFETPRITTEFGDMTSGHGPHQGVDFAVPQGTPIKEFIGGRVVYSGWQPWGGEVDVQIPGGMIERYLHLSALGVAKGQNLPRYGFLGLSGGGTPASGLGTWSSGPHSHVQIDHGNMLAASNPWPIWSAFGATDISAFYGGGASPLPSGAHGGGGQLPAARIAHLASGGIVLSHIRSASLGESGPEAIVPLSRLGSVLRQVQQQGGGDTAAGSSTAGGSSSPARSVTISHLIGTLNLTVGSGGSMSDTEKDELLSDLVEILEGAAKHFVSQVH